MMFPCQITVKALTPKQSRSNESKSVNHTTLPFQPGGGFQEEIMLKFCVLGSGSKGNATYIYINGHHYLIDCGFTKPGLQKRLAHINRDVSDIEAIIITHEHNDHQRPWIYSDRLAVNPGQVDPYPEFTAFPLSHDVPCYGYTITDPLTGYKIGLVTDTGEITEEALGHLFDCSALLVECNYTIEMLIDCPYPVERTERIASEVGHLRDECAIELIGSVAWPGLKHLVAIHLSSNNINPILLRHDLQSIKELPPSCTVEISKQDKPTELRVLL